MSAIEVRVSVVRNAIVGSSGIEPWEGFLLPILELPDGASVFLRVSDFVQALEQATFA
jgi:hypothetical protein